MRQEKLAVQVVSLNQSFPVVSSSGSHDNFLNSRNHILILERKKNEKVKKQVSKVFDLVNIPLARIGLYGYLRLQGNLGSWVLAKGPLAAQTKSIFILSEKNGSLKSDNLPSFFHLYTCKYVSFHHRLSFSIISIFLLDYTNIACILVLL